MKVITKLFGCLFLLCIFPSYVSANIQLEWEYNIGSKDFTPLTNPPTDPISAPQYGIIRIKVGASGHTLLLLERLDPLTITSERRLSIIDPQGKRIWLSDALPQKFNDPGSSFRILNVSPDSASLAFGDGFLPEIVVFSINLKASPQLSQFSIPGYKLADSAEMRTFPTVELPSVFPPNTFYTIGNTGSGANVDSLGTSIRKYSLNTLASMPLIVASESGTSGNNFVIRWNSTANVSYQVQQSINMTEWTDLGLALTGNGTQLSYSTPLGTGNKFYRIVQR